MGLCDSYAKVHDEKKESGMSRVEKKPPKRESKGEGEWTIEVEEPSEKSVVVKKVADNPEAYLIRRDINRCFKDK